MVVCVERTEISQENQVFIPSKIRERFDLRPGNEIIWGLVEDEAYVEVYIKFLRKRRQSLTKLIGKIDMGPTSPEDIDRVTSTPR